MPEGLLTIIPAKSHEEASTILVGALIESINSTETMVSLGLAGGSTPSLAYSMLGKYPEVISDIIFWLTDERWVDAEDDQSNLKMIKNSFNLDGMKILAPSFSGDSPSGDADAYTKHLLSSINNFTHAILGVGEDGHTASIFPNSDAIGEKGVKIVLSDVDTTPPIRLTATLELLAKIENVYLLITGENKKEITNKIINKKQDYPINRLIKMREGTILVTDQL
jgi:6-phosphogluconolactonase